MYQVRRLSQFTNNEQLKKYRCIEHHELIEERCNYTFKKTFNVKRHIRTQHLDHISTFKHYISKSNSRDARQSLVLVQNHFLFRHEIVTKSFINFQFEKTCLNIENSSVNVTDTILRVSASRSYLTSIMTIHDDMNIFEKKSCKILNATNDLNLDTENQQMFNVFSCVRNQQASSIVAFSFDNMNSVKVALLALNIISVTSDISIAMSIMFEQSREDLRTNSVFDTHIQSIRYTSHITIERDQILSTKRKSFIARSKMIENEDLRIHSNSLSNKERKRFSAQQSSLKRRRSSNTSIDRVAEIRLKDHLSVYRVKTSKRHHRQQKVIEWLTWETKVNCEKIRNFYKSFWNITENHYDICVFFSKNWRSIDFMHLMISWDDRTYSKKFNRAFYSYADHATTLIKAIVWFANEQWSRRNVELDKFLDVESWKSMNASHLCHHDHCIVHAVYESTDINRERFLCYELTLFFRRKERQISKFCDQHDSSCMMQISDLLYDRKW